MGKIIIVDGVGTRLSGFVLGSYNSKYCMGLLVYRCRFDQMTVMVILQGLKICTDR